MYYLRHPLRFECTGCGQCCTGRGDYYIEVTRAEQRRIQKFLGISWGWLRRRYVERFDDKIESLCTGAVGRCAFLGHDNRCRIYAVRPGQCRNYPFWPELVEHQSAWKTEARRCEGIGRGSVIPLTKLRAILKKQRA